MAATVDDPRDAELVRLIFADIFRDGGSYGASFEASDGRRYNIFLQRSAMPDAGGLHHRWLFGYFGTQAPDNPLPIISGSEDEHDLISHLDRFIAERIDGLATEPELARLHQLLHYIRHREPCFPDDIRGRQFRIMHF